MSKPKHKDPCTSCGAPPHLHQARGWCNACYLRWLLAGKPQEGPPPPRGSDVQRAQRVEDFEFLLRNGVTSLEELAERVGVSRGTAERYLREIRGSGCLAGLR